MNSLLYELQARKQRLERAIRAAEKFLETAPDGRLRINNRNYGASYYHITQACDTVGAYIPSAKRILATQLAQKDYAERFLKEAQRELSGIETCIHNFIRHKSESVFSDLNQQRQNLVTPYMTDNEKCSQIWLSLPFQTSPYEPEEKLFKTRRGDLVRSKSELMIADIYYELGIPYRYECEVTLRSGQKRYPDFTLFHAPRRIVIYHEHLGRMDEEDYVNKNLKKLQEYGEIGIFSGKNLLLSFETKKRPFDPNQFREEVKEIFWIN
ncbi:MAG: hypothetical protein J5750_05830 [Clostridiales bacterium]|nr:hypothetical protein [Clostridiales bacterium]